MNQKQRRVYGDWIRDTADRMGLRDWHFEIAWHEDGKRGREERQDDAQWGAWVEPLAGQKRATLNFAGWAMEQRPEGVRATVVHELVHLHFTAMVDQVRHDLADQLSASAYNLFERSFTRNLEYGVDAVAEEWSRRLDLPPKVSA